MFYTWRNPAGYTEVLSQRSDLWPTMGQIYEDCVNKPIDITPSPTPVPGIPGDANGDGLVNGVDYVIWLNHYKQTGTGGPTIGDFNSNGTIDGVDYVIWLNHYSL
jgi:hypothetical protein